MELYKLCALIQLLLLKCYVTYAEYMVDGVDIDAYLTKYYYMGANNPRAEIAELVQTDMGDARRVGLAMYQMMWGLPVTEEADTATVNMMKWRRCGRPDVENMEDMPNMDAMMGRPDHRSHRHRRYALQGSKWPQTALTYRISEYSRDLSVGDIRRDIAAAFELWASVTPLSFTEVRSRERADIDIRFTPRSHGDGFDFDGVGGTLAHAFYPQYGGASHFDDAERWTIDTHQGINLFQVAAHEFGHALGLKHSTVDSALMYPFYQGYVPDFTLPQDDLQGIQALYGKEQMPTMAPNPPTPYMPPTMPPGMPGVCEDARFDAVTIQYIDNRLYTVAFQGTHYMMISEGGLVEGYPRRISDGWAGLSRVDAALTLEWEFPQETQEWMYKSVTHILTGSQYYKYINMRLVSGYPKTIASEWGLPNNVDAMFQWGGNGKIYTIKGDEYYRHSSLQQTQPDTGYPRGMSSWDSQLNDVSSAFLSNNRQTYFFSGAQHYRFNDTAFAIARGFPKDNADEWLGCGAGGVHEGDSDSGSAVRGAAALVLMLAAFSLFL